MRHVGIPTSPVQKMYLNRLNDRQQRGALVVTMAASSSSPGATLNLLSVTSALATAQSQFDRVSGTKGSLTLREASELLNRCEGWCDMMCYLGCCMFQCPQPVVLSLHHQFD